MKSEDYLLEILDFYRFKIVEGTCGMADIESLTKVLEENMGLSGTKDEFAKFYGRSKDAVSSVINRRLLQKPKRNVVLYPFHEFSKKVPESWHEKR